MAPPSDLSEMRRCETPIGCHRDDGPGPGCDDGRLWGRDSSSGQDSKTLTYWASNQSPSSWAEDKTNLAPVLKKFEAADRDQGEAPGHRLAGPSTADPRLHHAAARAPRAQHRQHLGPVAAGDRRPSRRSPTRSSTRSAARTSSSRRPSRPAARWARTRRRCRTSAWSTASTTTRRCSPTPAWQAADHVGGARPDAKKLTQSSKGVYGMAMEGGSYTEGVALRLHLRQAARGRPVHLRRQGRLHKPGPGRGVSSTST